MFRYIYLLVFLFYNLSYCQTSVNVLIDSLNLTNNSKKRIELCQEIAMQLKTDDLRRALKYIELAENEAKSLENSKIYLAPIYKTTAKLYFANEVFDIALQNYQKSYNLYNELKNKEEVYKIENDFAIIYAQMNDKTKALQYFKKVYNYQLKKNDSLRLAQILNNIGTFYIVKDLDSSLYYFQKARLVAKNVKDSSLYIYTNTNLGRVYSLKNDYKNAKLYFDKVISLSKKNKNYRTNAFIYQSLAEHFLKTKENDSAIYYAKKVKEIYKENPYNFSYLNTLKILCDANLDLKNYKDAVLNYEDYNTIRDSMNIEDKAVSIERLKLQEEFKTQSKIEELSSQKKQFKYALITVSLFTGILILLFVLYKLRNKIRKSRIEKEQLQDEHIELSNTLDVKSKILVGKAMKEMNRTEITQEILLDLKKIRLGVERKDLKKGLDFIISRLNDNLSNNVWKEFEISFEQVHKIFFKNLQMKHPDLTSHDRRLCALLFLNLTTKEIAQITGQTLKGIENNRTRLRKKLDLTNEKINLSIYLSSLQE